MDEPTEADKLLADRAKLINIALLQQEIVDIHVGMEAMRVGMEAMRSELSANTAITQGIREVLDAAKGLPTLLKWVASMAAAVAAIVAAWHGIYPGSTK